MKKANKYSLALDYYLKDLFKIHGVFGRQHTQPRRIQMNKDGEYDSEVPKTVKMKDIEKTYLLEK